MRNIFVFCKIRSNVLNVKYDFFFQMLLEVGFQAGQHEILADVFSKDIAQQIFEQAKQMKKTRQNNMKQSKKISDELTAAFKTMHAAKDKFRRAYDDQVRATEAYKKVSDFQNQF